MSPQKVADWAPNDYTDGKPKGQWKTEYPIEARKGIRYETAYLVVLFFGCLIATLAVLYKSCEVHSPTPLSDASGQNVGQSPMWLGAIGALFAGTLGGCCFGMKCMYHFVAKLRWHEDRRLWRMLSPILSGVVALFMVFLSASGLLQIFDEKFIEKPVRVMAVGFLVGLFSDKALAKMAEIADTIFGSKDNDTTIQEKPEQAKSPEKQ